jgi:uncharacterized membrane protein
MTQKLIHFITLILLVLITGLFWGTWFSISKTIETFSVAEFIHIGKTIIHNVAIPMKIIMPSCILLMAVSLWLYPQKNTMGFYFIVSAFALLIASLVITVGIEVPMDNQIKTWTPETAPSNWEAIRTNWEFFHTIRTFTSFASFSFFSAALLKTFQK